MIIDSHAHYAHAKFEGEFSYLCERNGEYAAERVELSGLIDEMKNQGLVGAIEVSIGFYSIEKQMALASEHRGFLHTTVGVHPTRCINIDPRNRKKLREYAEKNAPVAIGETGLDYHYPRREQYRLRQKRWFIYQIKLADELGLPLVLHIRDAHGDALGLLRRNASRLHGGVAHCFTGDVELAEKYIALGFSLGIGGKLLCDDEVGRVLCETVKSVPLSSILVETDAPFVLPDTDGLECSKNQRKRLCNSSLILPSVIRKIAELRGETYDAVEDAIYRNTVRLFGLDGKEKGDE